MKDGSTAMTQRSRERVPSESMLALPDPRMPDRANPPTNFWWSLFLTALAWSICTGFQLDRQSTRNTMLRFLRKRFLQKRPALFKSGQWHFYQDNAPVHNSILVTDYLTKMGIKTVPQPPDLVPCDFWLFPKLRSCHYEIIEEMKKAVTNVIDTLIQKDFHGAFQKFFEWYNKYIAARGDCFKGDLSFMCVLSIKVPIQKKSGNLFNDLVWGNWSCIYPERNE